VLQALARDYEKWATSETYRIERAGGLCHVDTEGEDEGFQLALPSEVRAVSAPMAPVAAPTSINATADQVPVKESVSLPLSFNIEGSTVTTTEVPDIALSDVVTKNSLPVLTDDICLFPGSEPIVRVEEAPSNARRIFTGVDIMADMESIWEVLTAFERLQDVVPSLVKNEVNCPPNPCEHRT
jgi:hypothetical protein